MSLFNPEHINILVPMAGVGKRFRDAGYRDPKPFIPVAGVPMVKRVLDNLRTPDVPNRVILVSPAYEGYDLPLNDDDLWVEVRHPTRGAVETCLLAERHFDNDEPLLVANCDQLFQVAIIDFLAAMGRFDAGIMVFNSTNPHHSYARLDGDRVVEVREKRVISDNALLGVYYFACGSDFASACKWAIETNETTGGEFYIAPSLNYLLGMGLLVGAYEVDVHRKHILGTPEELRIFEDKVASGKVTL